MGRYIDEILQPGEKVLYSTNAHWIFFLPAIAGWVVTIVFIVMEQLKAKLAEQGALAKIIGPSPAPVKTAALETGGLAHVVGEEAHPRSVLYMYLVPSQPRR